MAKFTDPFSYAFGDKEQDINFNDRPGQIPYLAMDPGQLTLGNNFNRGALDAYRQEAMRTGPSKYSRIAMGQLDRDVLGMRANAKSGAQGAAAAARSQLAMRGGLTGGAAERVSKSAADSAINAAQNAEASGAKGRAMISMEDEKDRMSGLGQLNGMELGAAQFGHSVDEGNMNRMIGENTRRNMYNQNLYNQQMTAWASGKQAQATANSGKK